ncbi:MAG TPA: phenylalanine--tRNA ligase subunit beta [Blastocatellia bacterium]|nr:phenylalanine--tRNA ligase subunit beta [Blastocatellia bacterium]
MRVSYNWLRDLVSITDGPKELAEKLTMAGFAVDAVDRVGEDHVLDIDVLSNRPDALSHLGVAREAALLYGTAVNQIESTPAGGEDPESDITKAAAIEILDPELCPRYAARVIRGVKVGPSPAWLVERLETIGQRSVNNIADITNYVMFELGQPNHAFDLKKLHGQKIIVRRARAGERVVTLDGVTRELSPETLVIADASRPVAIAGIMGGEETEISDYTADVLIECAYFSPASVRRTARQLGLDTEASYRFERGVDFEGQVRAADRVARLVQQIAGGKVLKGAIDVYPAPIVRERVIMRESRVKELTGLNVELDRSAGILKALEFTVEVDGSSRTLAAIPPSFRIDVSREADLVEEVARHAGYDLIESTLPAWSGSGNYLPGEGPRRGTRALLTALGFVEAVSFSFVNAEHDRLFAGEAHSSIPVSNPIDVDENEMRSTLSAGLLESLKRNFNQGQRDLRLFEIGRVFTYDSRGGRPEEREMLGIVMTGSVVFGDWREHRDVDFYDLKGVIESLVHSLSLTGFTIDRASVEYLHPGQSAALVRDGFNLARFGRLHPKIASFFKFRQPVFVAEIEFQKLLDITGEAARYRPLSKFPAISRDVSTLLPESVPWTEIEKAIAALGAHEIAGVAVFDVYKGQGVAAGTRSLAFRVTYRDEDRTLTDEEVTVVHERLREMLRTRFGAQLR